MCKTTAEGTVDTKRIFELIKTGGLDQALAEVQTFLAAQPPRDLWELRACGWVLHDRIKETIKVGQWGPAADLLKVFDELDIPEDEPLHRARVSLDTRLNPTHIALERGRKASDDGDHDSALAIFRQSVKDLDGADDAQTALAWELHNVITSELRSEQSDKQIGSALIEEYRALSIERPSRLHSLMLANALRLGVDYPQLAEFIVWWDIRNLMPEDHERYSPHDAGREFPSTVERLIRVVYELVKAGKARSHLPWIVDFVEAHYEAYPDREWFPYYLGKLYVSADRAAEARALVLPIMRAKRNEFWAWDVLASTFPGDSKTRLACLCRALTCRAQEKFLVNVRLEVTQFLRMDDQLHAAKHEIELVIKTRTDQGWSLPHELIAMRDAAWFQQTHARNSNLHLYVQLSETVDGLLAEGVEMTPGVVTGFQPARDGRPGRHFVAFRSVDAICEIPVKEHQFPCLHDVLAGSTIDVAVSKGNGSWQVIRVDPRKGSPWDIYDTEVGVVAGRDEARGRTYVVIGNGPNDEISASHRYVPGASLFQSGTLVNVRIHRRNTDDRRISNIVTMDELSATDLPQFVMEFEGVFSSVRAFGFISGDNTGDGDIFVPPCIVNEYTPRSNGRVRGRAIHAWNRKQGQAGWVAASTHACDSPEFSKTSLD
jgi:hypothetical protein